MNLKYWEWENAPFKEKVKSPRVKEIAKVFFPNDTQAYRFSYALVLVKEKKRLRLRDCPEDLPTATWKRYLDFGVRVGLLKHEDDAYEFTDRFTNPMKNFAAYVKAWSESSGKEDLDAVFSNARKEKQEKRGGRTREDG